jgi:hypothetical protein
MRRTAKLIVLLAAVAAMAAPAIGGAGIKIILVPIDGCFPADAKTSTSNNFSFVTETCSFTYQGNYLAVEGSSLGGDSGRSGGAYVYTKVTVTLKRGTNVLLSCSYRDGWNPLGSSCRAAKTFGGSIPVGATLTCTAQNKPDYPANYLTVQGACFSIGTRLN